MIGSVQPSGNLLCGGNIASTRLRPVLRTECNVWSESAAKTYQDSCHPPPAPIPDVHLARLRPVARSSVKMKVSLMETGSSTSPTPTLKSDLYMKYMSLVALTAQNALEGVSVRYSRTRTQDLYITSTATVMGEILKLIASVCLLANEEASFKGAFGTIFGAIQKSPFDTLKVALISLIYVVQNNLLYFAASNLDVATFQVSYQLKILTTALLFVLMLRTKLIATQWLSLVILFVGVVLVNLANLAATGVQTVVNAEDPFLGFVAVVFACCLSGFAGVYFEKVLKSTSASVWLRNVQLSFLSIPLALALSYSYDWTPISERGFFFGYDSLVWFVIFVKASGGLIVALVVKYANNILKGFSTSIAIIIGCVANVFLFGVQLNTEFLLGTVLVISSVFLYGYRPSSTNAGEK